VGLCGNGHGGIFRVGKRVAVLPALFGAVVYRMFGDGVVKAAVVVGLGKIVGYGKRRSIRVFVTRTRFRLSNG
jgi:hypothetical protein